MTTERTTHGLSRPLVALLAELYQFVTMASTKSPSASPSASSGVSVPSSVAVTGVPVEIE
jgi:hypothetical protein